MSKKTEENDCIVLHRTREIDMEDAAVITDYDPKRPIIYENEIASILGVAHAP